MPKKVVHADRVRAIASAAISAIGEIGLDALRLRDVAAAGAMTTGAVTHYFDGKDAVLEAALAEVVRRIFEGQDEVEVQLERGTPVDAIAAFLPNTDERRRDWKVWFAFWGRAAADERLRGLHKRYYAEVIGRLEVLLARRFPPGRRAGLADAIVAAVDGIGIRAALEPEDWPPERQRRTLGLLLDPLLTPKRTPR
jgi:TetR/AcrR family transcriptional repressor of bet genes